MKSTSFCLKLQYLMCVHACRLIIALALLQNFPQFTKLYSSPSAAAVQKKIDEDKLNHEDEVVTTTKISIQQLSNHPADLSKLALENLTTTIKQNNELTVAKELPWRITPSQDINRRFKHYLMLSKIRLTCKCTNP